MAHRSCQNIRTLWAEGEQGRLEMMCNPQPGITAGDVGHLVGKQVTLLRNRSLCMTTIKIKMYFPLPPGQNRRETLLKTQCNGRVHALWLCKMARKQFLNPTFLCVCVLAHACTQSQNTHSPPEPTRVCEHTECSTHAHSHRGTVKHSNHCKYIHAYVHRQNLGFPAKPEQFSVIKKGSLQQST